MCNKRIQLKVCKQNSLNGNNNKCPHFLSKVSFRKPSLREIDTSSYNLFVLQQCKVLKIRVLHDCR